MSLSCFSSEDESEVSTEDSDDEQRYIIESHQVFIVENHTEDSKIIKYEFPEDNIKTESELLPHSTESRPSSRLNKDGLSQVDDPLWIGRIEEIDEEENSNSTEEIETKSSNTDSSIDEYSTDSAVHVINLNIATNEVSNNRNANITQNKLRNKKLKFLASRLAEVLKNSDNVKNGPIQSSSFKNSICHDRRDISTPMDFHGSNIEHAPPCYGNDTSEASLRLINKKTTNFDFTHTKLVNSDTQHKHRRKFKRIKCSKWAKGNFMSQTKKPLKSCSNIINPNGKKRGRPKKSTITQNEESNFVLNSEMFPPVTDLGTQATQLLKSCSNMINPNRKKRGRPKRSKITQNGESNVVLNSEISPPVTGLGTQTQPLKSCSNMINPNGKKRGRPKKSKIIHIGESNVLNSTKFQPVTELGKSISLCTTKHISQSSQQISAHLNKDCVDEFNSDCLLDGCEGLDPLYSNEIDSRECNNTMIQNDTKEFEKKEVFTKYENEAQENKCCVKLALRNIKEYHPINQSITSSKNLSNLLFNRSRTDNEQYKQVGRLNSEIYKTNRSKNPQYTYADNRQDENLITNQSLENEVVQSNKDDSSTESCGSDSEIEQLLQQNINSKYLQNSLIDCAYKGDGKANIRNGSELQNKEISTNKFKYQQTPNNLRTSIQKSHVQDLSNTSTDSSAISDDLPFLLSQKRRNFLKCCALFFNNSTKYKCMKMGDLLTLMTVENQNFNSHVSRAHKLTCPKLKFKEITAAQTSYEETINKYRQPFVVMFCKVYNRLIHNQYRKLFSEQYKALTIAWFLKMFLRISFLSDPLSTFLLAAKSNLTLLLPNNLQQLPIVYDVLVLNEAEFWSNCSLVLDFILSCFETKEDFKDFDVTHSNTFSTEHENYSNVIAEVIKSVSIYPQKDSKTDSRIKNKPQLQNKSTNELKYLDSERVDQCSDQRQFLSEFEKSQITSTEQRSKNETQTQKRELPLIQQSYLETKQKTKPITETKTRKINKSFISTSYRFKEKDEMTNKSKAPKKTKYDREHASPEPKQPTMNLKSSHLISKQVLENAKTTKSSKVNLLAYPKETNDSTYSKNSAPVKLLDYNNVPSNKSHTLHQFEQLIKPNEKHNAECNTNMFREAQKQSHNQSSMFNSESRLINRAPSYYDQYIPPSPYYLSHILNPMYPQHIHPSAWFNSTADRFIAQLPAFGHTFAQHPAYLNTVDATRTSMALPPLHNPHPSATWANDINAYVSTIQSLNSFADRTSRVNSDINTEGMSSYSNNTASNGGSSGILSQLLRPASNTASVTNSANYYQ